ncbi:Transmembrane protein 161A [Plecturocebus cupreus]
MAGLLVLWAWSLPKPRRPPAAATAATYPQVVRVYCYVTVVSLQYLTPLILTLNCTLLLKTLGELLLRCGGEEGRGWKIEQRGSGVWRGPGRRRGPVRRGLSRRWSLGRGCLGEEVEPGEGRCRAGGRAWARGGDCGGYSWGLGPAPLLSPDPSSASAARVGPEEDEVQQTAARILGALGGLLTPLFLRGVLAYFIWWTAACQLLSSLFGLYFHQHLAGS